MKLLVFGASGRTGRCVVEQALERGHSVTAFVRDPAKLDLTHEALTHDALTVVTGDISDPASIDAAMPGHDAVISALGNVNRKPNTELSDGTRAICDAMKTHGVPRILCVTSLGVGDSYRQVGNLMFKIIIKTLARNIWGDKLRQERVIRDSGLAYVIARPGGLTEAAPTGSWQAVPADAPFPKKAMIPRADVARFLLDQAEQTDGPNAVLSLAS